MKAIKDFKEWLDWIDPGIGTRQLAFRGTVVRIYNSELPKVPLNHEYTTRILLLLDLVRWIEKINGSK